MTTRQLHNRWLRTKRHLQSISQNPRALRDAARAVHAAAVAAEHAASWGSLCRSPDAAAA
jgi:hypothetical protein